MLNFLYCLYIVEYIDHYDKRLQCEQESTLLEWNAKRRVLPEHELYVYVEHYILTWQNLERICIGNTDLHVVDW